MIKNYVDIDTKLDKVNDECGVFGIYRNDDDIDVVAAANDALYRLIACCYINTCRFVAFGKAVVHCNHSVTFC